MKYLLTPRFVFDDIFQITPAFLQAHQIRGCLIDLDGTLVSRHAPLGNSALRAWFTSLRQAGITPLLLSNNKAVRVQRFAESIQADWHSRACKPLPFGFQAGAKRLQLPFSQIAVIGDQIYTDILGGNLVGALTCYIETIDRHDFVIAARYRLLEHFFIQRGRRRSEHGN